MLLAIDIGNTNITLGVFQGGSIKATWRLATDPRRMPDEYGMAILNLLPIPVLDGGHLLYYSIEWIRGRPLSEAVQVAGQQVGMVALLMLMTLAFYNDILRLLG